MPHAFVPPSLRHFEPRRVIPGPGMRHMAFEYDLVEALRPSLVVDAGSGDAMSFFTYCQSMKDHDVDGIAYAIDAWRVAPPASHPDAAYDAINAHGRQHYPGIHYLVDFPPAEAWVHFSEGTVDLLRLDGTRPELCDGAVLEAWLARVRPGGVIAFHGAGQPGRDSAWTELAARGDSLGLSDGRGLGVFRKAGGEPPEADLLRLAFVQREVDALDRLYLHGRQHHQLRRLIDRFIRGKPAG